MTLCSTEKSRIRVERLLLSSNPSAVHLAMSAIAIANGKNVAPPPLFKPASVKPRVVAEVPALSTLPVDEQQCEKALKALLAHVAKVQEKREQEDLLGEQEEKVFLVVGLKKAAKREIHKPIRLCVSPLARFGLEVSALSCSS